MKNPIVSIIVTTYNRRELLERAINSILEQDYKNYKIIIVDDGSTDGTKHYLEDLKWCNRIEKIIIHDKNYGQTIAKNAGINNIVEGSKYFGFFDSDDIMLSGAITSLVGEFEILGNSVSQVCGQCRDMLTGNFTGWFDGDSPYFTFEDAISGRIRGDFWRLVNVEMLGELRFDSRAAGGLSLVWHDLLKKAPGYISESVVRIYDQTIIERQSVPSFNDKRCRGKMYTHFAYINRFEQELLSISPERYGNIALEVARWAKLSGELKTSLKYLYLAKDYVPVKNLFTVALQQVVPRKFLKILKFHKTKKYRVELA